VYFLLEVLESQQDILANTYSDGSATQQDGRLYRMALVLDDADVHTVDHMGEPMD